MLAGGFIPYRSDVDTEFLGGDEGFELGVGSVGEAVADSEGVFGAGFHDVWKDFNAESRSSQRERKG